MRTDESGKDEPRVRFERPLDVRVMTIDGTRCSEGRLIEISDSEAQIELTGQAAELSEFFLMLTGFGNPVFRRCRRKWVHGAQMGVSFERPTSVLNRQRNFQKNRRTLPIRQILLQTPQGVQRKAGHDGPADRQLFRRL